MYCAVQAPKEICLEKRKQERGGSSDDGGTAASDWLASNVGVLSAGTRPESFHFEAYAMKNMHI